MTEFNPEKGEIKTNKNEVLKNLERQPQAIEKVENKLDKKENHEQTNKVEAAREKLKASQEHQPSLKPVETEKKPEIKRRFSDSAARKQAYLLTMKSLRHQLRPAQVTFSKLIHVRPIEVASELLEETFYRPSFLWGGVIGGLVFGGGLYLIARNQGYPLSGSEFTIGLIGGGCLGFILEKLISLIRSKRPKK